ncbi:MAG: hypothetical protein V4598_11060 [Bdellovibrionota bacterium]
MIRFLLIIFTLSLFSGCATTPEAPRVYEEVIEITEVNPNRLTALTKQNIFHLAKVYEMKPFLYTRKIHVQSYVVPHSHPTLTLNTRNAEKPHQLLATWLHEEFHWWVGMNMANHDKALKELKLLYPKLPGEGNVSPRSTYLHLIICYLEHSALVHFLGESEAKEIIQELITKDKLYPWVYTQVLQNKKKIGSIVMKHKLLPAPLKR